MIPLSTTDQQCEKVTSNLLEAQLAAAQLSLKAWNELNSNQKAQLFLQSSRTFEDSFIEEFKSWEQPDITLNSLRNEK